MDQVAELTNSPWRDVWEMTVLEWLNLVCYNNDKAAWKKAELEKWKLTH